MDLRGTARDFAGELSSLLNRTVCDGIRITPVVSDPDRASLGYGITKDDLELLEGIPLTLGNKPPIGYLGLSYRLGPDEEGEYLMVTSSFMGVFLDAELERTLLHYDYERHKADGYPEAHLQVCAETPVWDELSERIDRPGRPLQRLHLPVGGRRYRPSLEDLVEFLITEEIADGRPGWSTVVEQGRENFQRQQLRAAVRRDPEAAEAQLRAMGRLDGG